MPQQFYVYILASEPRGTLYVGVTRNLARRVLQHKQGSVEGFTKKYRIHRLVHYEIAAHAADAIRREERLKK